MSILYPQLQLFSLYSSGASIGDTTVVLSEMKTIDGVLLTMADFGTKGFITIDPGAGTLEEQISFTGITQNANGTATLTGVKTVLCVSPYTETSGLAKEHSGGSTVAVAVTSGFLNTFTNKLNNETITGTWTIPTHTSSDVHQPASIEYVNNIALSGAPNASETVKGLVELATAAECAAGTSAGATGARLVVPASNCKSSSAGAGDANKVPVLDANGLLDQTFLGGARTWAGVNSFTADNCQITSDANSANDAVRMSLMQAEISKGYTTGTAGETIAVGNALYLKASDGKLWKTAGTADESTFSFVGIAVSAGNANATIYYAKPGDIATGMSGLTAGTPYFITDTAGLVGTAPGSRYAKIGQALSATTMLVKEPKFRASGSQVFSSTTTAVQTCGFYPARIMVYALQGVSCSHTDNAENNVCMKHRFETGTTSYFTWEGSYAYSVAEGAGVGHYGTVSARSATGFTLSNTKAGGNNATVYWVAESL